MIGVYNASPTTVPVIAPLRYNSVTIDIISYEDD